MLTVAHPGEGIKTLLELKILHLGSFKKGALILNLQSLSKKLEVQDHLKDRLWTEVGFVQKLVKVWTQTLIKYLRGTFATLELKVDPVFTKLDLYKLWTKSGHG